ncbi:MAG: Bax inhibitor-1/YccA family protein [Bacilli bacterium]
MNNKLMGKVFLWMFIGLLITFSTGLIIANNDVMYTAVYNGAWYIVFAVIELIIVIYLSLRVLKIKPGTAKFWFLLYSFISGLTFGSIFVFYKMSSTIFIFLITAILFLILSLIGYFTKIDLKKIGTYCLFGLVAVIIVTIVNIFLHSDTIMLYSSIICILLFVGITAYDVQKIKSLENSNIPQDNLAIYGALELYLDFINIFLHLLTIFGKEND